MTRSCKPFNRRRGVALVIVLAFLVLTATLVLLLLSRSSAARQVGHGDFQSSRADDLARSALSIITADLKQEMSDGSNIGPGATPTLTPKNNKDVVPARNGDSTDVPNLVRLSLRSDPIAAPGVPSRASAVNSATDISLNGRSVSTSRWNDHYLVPKVHTSNDDTTPVTTFAAPDWVIVTRSGPSIHTAVGSGATGLNNPDPANTNFVVGRYAYAVYDEGGLLDINVAAFPSPTPSPPNQIGRKGSVACADLTALPTTSSSTVTNTSINRIIGWRNFATAQPSGAFPAFTFTASATAAVSTYFLDRTRDFRTVSATTNVDGRTDQNFVTRAELIKLRADSRAGAASMLQYLGTFSRERNLPTWSDSATRLASRFPLSRFDLFASPSSNAANIKRYFGLVYVPATQTTPEHWQYTGPTGNGPRSSIPVLTGNGQDPDLAVLLRYAYPTSTPDGEILSIIASLIDQRDTDNHTTWIEYGDPATPLKAYGVDNMPVTGAPPPPPNAVILKRSFRNVGELGYAFRNASSKLDFHTASSVDARLLDLFTYNTATVRAGAVSLNTQNATVLSAILKEAFATESASAGVTTAQAKAAATSIVNATAALPAIGREDVARLAAAPTNAPFSNNAESRETVSRALAELGQTRTWCLLIDVVAQAGRYPTTAASLADFNVEGEKRYWLHVAIDRFTATIIDQQLEAVYE